MVKARIKKVKFFVVNVTFVSSGSVSNGCDKSEASDDGPAHIDKVDGRRGSRGMKTDATLC